MNFEFFWKIENFSTRFYDLEEELISPTFYADSFSGINWYLTIRITKYKKKNVTNKYISCFLHRDEDGGLDEAVPIDFTIEARGPDEEVIFSHSYKKYPFNKDSKCGFKQFAKLREIAHILSHKTKNTLILRCHLTNDQLPFYTVPKNKCNAYTNISMNKHFFPWSVKCDESLKWPANRSFYIPEQTPLEVTISTIEDKITITINRVKVWPCVAQLITCCLQWLDKSGNIVRTDNCSYYFGHKRFNDTWKYPTSVTKSKVQNWMFSSPRSRFNLVFCFFVSNGIIVNTDNKVRHSLPGENPMHCLQLFSPLLLDFKKLCIHKSNCNVSLRVENSEFQAHLSVFSVRAPKFLKLIEELLSRNQTEIEVPDVAEFVFTIFLLYVYTGKIILFGDAEDMLDVLEFACTYDVKELTDPCVFYLNDLVTKENVLKIYARAVKVQCKLLQDVLNMFLQNNLDLFDSLNWIHFSTIHPKLANLIFVTNC